MTKSYPPHYSNSSNTIISLKNSDWKKQIELKFFWNISKILLPSSDKIQIWEVNEYKRKYYLIPLFHFEAFNFCFLKFYSQNFVSGINGSKVLWWNFACKLQEWSASLQFFASIISWDVHANIYHVILKSV